MARKRTLLAGNRNGEQNMESSSPVTVWKQALIAPDDFYEFFICQGCVLQLEARNKMHQW